MTTQVSAALLFDCFGVIACLQTPQTERQLYTLACGSDTKETGVDAPSAAPFTMSQFGTTYRDIRKPYDAGEWDAPHYWRQVATQLGVTFTPQQITQLIEADLNSWSQVDNSMVNYVGELDDAGYRLGLLSNIPVELAARYRTKPWLRHFHSVTWSCDIRVAKPDAGAFQHAATQLGVPYSDMLFIDDTAPNIAGAAALGIPTHHFVGEKELRAALHH